jgi:hypothetical protein
MINCCRTLIHSDSQNQQKCSINHRVEQQPQATQRMWYLVKLTIATNHN